MGHAPMPWRGFVAVWPACKVWEGGLSMDALAEKLDTKLRNWRPETVAEVRQRVVEGNSGTS